VLVDKVSFKFVIGRAPDSGRLDSLFDEESIDELLMDLNHQSGSSLKAEEVEGFRDSNHGTE
jgi:hypothetical protein